MTGRLIFTTPRRVQVWKYVISHRQLLMRAVRSPAYRTRIDLLFTDVSFMQIPTAFLGISVVEADHADLPALPVEAIASDQTVFKLVSNVSVSFIAAAAFANIEDDREYDEDSQFNTISSF